jgi:ribose-phosphate pyrophosphokinase
MKDMIIDLIKKEDQKDNIGFSFFNDGHIHFNLEDYSPYEIFQIECNTLKIITRLTSSDHLIKLMMVCNSLERYKGLSFKRKVLEITYMIGARYDRIMNEGDSLDIEVYANLINSLNFDEVNILHPHSDVTCALIKNSHYIMPYNGVKKALCDFLQEGKDVVLISPDAGATKTISNFVKVIKEYRISLLTIDIVQCSKHRDKEGKPFVTVLNGELCKDKPCLVIDDICDGGGTFLSLQEEIKKYNPSKLGLYVTHGIFSAGYKHLLEKYDKIYTTNSYKKQPEITNLIIV